MTPQEIADKLASLQRQVSELSASFYKNNFTSSQVFNKDCVFNTRLKVPHYTSAPTVAEVGDLIEIGGKLYICTDDTTPTFTVVGTQS